METMRKKIFIILNSLRILYVNAREEQEFESPAIRRGLERLISFLPSWALEGICKWASRKKEVEIGTWTRQFWNIASTQLFCLDYGLPRI